MVGAPQAGLYFNETVHVRHQPFTRRLRYRLFQLFLDIDTIGETAKRTRLLRYNQSGILSVHDSDHGDRSGAPLRAWAEQAFATASVRLDGGRIFLLCMPRFFGRVFNPLSVYFGYGPDNALRGVIYEVNNTFRETHAYVTPYAPNRVASAPKQLHVSPFFDIEGQYHFRVRPPDGAFALSILNDVEGTVRHTATLNGRRLPLSDATLLRAITSLPLQSIGVMAAIHWEALFIWMRGAGYRAKPPPPRTPLTSAPEQLSLTQAHPW
ncbi:MAG: DUF1365 family protein [Alphaproteobacteria bacterium]|nr:DUF1365 family protein [Alphaproteobacteria bacterium]